MIPLVGFKKELDLQTELVHRVAKAVQAEKKVKPNYLVGTMIEVPRGALTTDEFAQTTEYFSFGTNDLTRTGRIVGGSPRAAGATRWAQRVGRTVSISPKPSRSSPFDFVVFVFADGRDGSLAFLPLGVVQNAAVPVVTGVIHHHLRTR
ncbi:MAG: hypothetical protein KIS67_15760 [Verrucomicrobiae bacterium]|nr:hypothetical protein [Verrucomicrobiae bacterium]